MARLKPKESTWKRLLALSQNVCAFPGCETPIFDESGTLLADICHIEAANQKGERYNKHMTDEERRAFENLLLLCKTHHAKTNNVAEFPVERMQKIKRDHESASNGEQEVDNLGAKINALDKEYGAIYITEVSGGQVNGLM